MLLHDMVFGSSSNLLTIWQRPRHHVREAFEAYGWLADCRQQGQPIGDCHMMEWAEVEHDMEFLLVHFWPMAISCMVFVRVWPKIATLPSVGNQTYMLKHVVLARIKLNERTAARTAVYTSPCNNTNID